MDEETSAEIQAWGDAKFAEGFEAGVAFTQGLYAGAARKKAQDTSDMVSTIRAIGRDHRPLSVSVERDTLTCACGYESSNYDGLEEHRAQMIVEALLGEGE